MNDTIKAIDRIILRTPDIGCGCRSHLILTIFGNLNAKILLSLIVQISIGNIHPAMHFHTHIRQLLFKIQIGERIHDGKIFSDDTHS